MTKFDESFYKKIFSEIEFYSNSLYEYYMEMGKERGLSPTDTAVLIAKAAKEVAFAIAQDIESLDYIEDEEEE